MKIVFLGTSSFAVPALEALTGSANHTVALTVTQPDRPAGRGLQLHKSPVKVFCEEHGMPLFQPDEVCADDALAKIKEINPDIVVVASFGSILRNNLLTLPPKGCVNIHASLLPKYRGASPVAHAIMNGERTTGVSIFHIVRKLDAGPVYATRQTSIHPEETCGTLEERLARLGAALLLETLSGIQHGMLDPMPQDDILATAAPKLTRSICAVAWDDHADAIANKVRALQPRPGATTRFRHGDRTVQITLISAHAVDGERLAPPGRIAPADHEGIDVVCGGGTVLRVTMLRPENKRPMTATEFANGYRLSPTSAFF